VRLFGKNFTKQELLKYCGNIGQIAGVDELAYGSGKARGMRLLRVRNGNGLVFDLMPDKGMDIATLSYKGINISWLSKNGINAPQYAYPVLNEFDRYFSGGMLLTCGLKNCGPDHVDEMGRFQYLHGRIGITPSEQSWAASDWIGDELTIQAGALVRDCMLGSHNLTLKRSIKTAMSSCELEITDEIENQESRSSDYMVLYHFNFGFPFISERTKLILPEPLEPIRPRNEDAEKGLLAWQSLSEPFDCYPEQVFFHKLTGANGTCTVRLENEALGIGAFLSYFDDSLPVLTQWKSMQSGEYVVGIEPGNSFIRGMDNEKRNGTVASLAPFSSVKCKIKLGFYDL